MAQFLPFLPIVCAVLIVCVVAQFVLIISINARFARQTKMLRQFFSGPQGEDLEGLLERTLTQSHIAIEHSAQALELAKHEVARNQSGIQKFALHRYNAFEGVAGEQSFSIALLDGNGNGAVISSILGRQNSRCFGKSIVGGQPVQPLSDEEELVFLQAIQSDKSVRINNKKEPDSMNGKAKIEQKKSNKVALEAKQN